MTSKETSKKNLTLLERCNRSPELLERLEECAYCFELMQKVKAMARIKGQTVTERELDKIKEGKITLEELASISDKLDKDLTAFGVSLKAEAKKLHKYINSKQC